MNATEPRFRQIASVWCVFILLGKACVYAERPPREVHRLMTSWGESVTADTAWQEYPRPQMEREDWLSLNGYWDYALIGPGEAWTGDRVENSVYDPFVTGETHPPSNWDGRILVPYAIESTLSGVQKLVRPTQTLWYRRSLEVPSDWKGRRLKLNFGAVDWHAIVLVNGKQVGER